MKLQGGRCRPISVRMSSGAGVRGCWTEDPPLEKGQRYPVAGERGIDRPRLSSSFRRDLPE